MVDVLPPGGRVGVLIKPQFEAGRAKVPGGVVLIRRYTAKWWQEIKAFGTETLGAE